MEGSLVQVMRTHNNEKGQSAIEFILTIAFALGVTFLFVNQALNLTEGYLAHYVNFMASRAYLVHDGGGIRKDNNLNLAAAKANEVYKSYPLENFGIKADFKVISSNDANGIFTGTVVQFEKPLSALPVVGGGEDAIFYSESFLGKEPMRITCSEMICAAISGSLNECNSGADNMDIVLYDNGC
jgi:hypothetical protein